MNSIPAWVIYLDPAFKGLRLLGGMRGLRSTHKVLGSISSTGRKKGGGKEKSMGEGRGRKKRDSNF